ncbi:Oidioi.mRNA.OKI2018_I69.XSR.g16097.t1.cds [Oikopleura dioica]|uniref:Oidioi.mRNA.OKI2018_I69.XSR.g16097.t1.cds n=1 Tax=Oikopleura dioica TaxID=34765 RepID=A0ABN7SK30_OIKDI|nr:Oidioi.mRNA.OKI2018_I69.XSR.g16097.t1.cds [Oikopleura dioica]
MDDDDMLPSVSERGSPHGSPTASDDEDGGPSIIQHRARIIECLSDMMAQSLQAMQEYFSNHDDYTALSEKDQKTLFQASIMEILIVKCFFTYRQGRFYTDQGVEIISRETLLLGTNDQTFVNGFFDFFSQMERLNFSEEQALILMSISMFDPNRVEIVHLDEPDRVRNLFNKYIAELSASLPTSGLLLRSSLKDLKSGFKDILMRSSTNPMVDLGENVYNFLSMMTNSARWQQ